MSCKLDLLSFITAWWMELWSCVSFGWSRNGERHAITGFP